MKFKNNLVNNNLSYRCIHRTCKTLLTISKEDVRKISTKEENNKIKYSFNPLRKAENGAKFKQIIDINLDKPLNWHIKNLIENNINIKSKKKIISFYLCSLFQ